MHVDTVRVRSDEERHAVLAQNRIDKVNEGATVLKSEEGVHGFMGGYDLDVGVGVGEFVVEPLSFLLHVWPVGIVAPLGADEEDLN